MPNNVEDHGLDQLQRGRPSCESATVSSELAEDHHGGGMEALGLQAEIQ